MKILEIRYGIKEIAIMPSKSLLIYLINNLSVLNKAALGKDDGTETKENNYLI